MGAILVAFFCGMLLGRSREPDRAALPSELEWAALRAELVRAQRDRDSERREGERLSAELSSLRDWINLLGESSSTADGADCEDASLRGESTASQHREADVDEQERIASLTPGFDEQALIDAGLSAQEAERLRDLYIEVEMEKAVLGAEAAREGWARTYRHFRAIREVDESVRDDLDDEAYDRFLYASRRPNRLIVREVIEGSPADLAGVRRGDKILRYQGSRVFATSELEALASKSGVGEYVRLEVVRGRRELSLIGPEIPVGILASVTLDRPQIQ